MDKERLGQYLPVKKKAEIPRKIAERVYLCNGRFIRKPFFYNIKTGQANVSAELFCFSAGCTFAYGVAGDGTKEKCTDKKRLRHFVEMDSRFGILTDKQFDRLVKDIIRFGKANRREIIYVYPKSLAQNWVTPTNQKQWIISHSSPEPSSRENVEKNRALINRELQKLGSHLRIISKADFIPRDYDIKIAKEE